MSGIKMVTIGWLEELMMLSMWGKLNHIFDAFFSLILDSFYGLDVSEVTHIWIFNLPLNILVDTGLGQPKLNLLWFHIQNVLRLLLLVLTMRWSTEFKPVFCSAPYLWLPLFNQTPSWKATTCCRLKGREYMLLWHWWMVFPTVMI